MAKINFKQGFHRIFLIICIIIIIIGGFVSWIDALSDSNKINKDDIQLQCIKEEQTKRPKFKERLNQNRYIIYTYSKNEINNRFFKYKVTHGNYSKYCELNKKYFLNKCLKKGDYVSNYNKKTFVSLEYSTDSYPSYTKYEDIEINEFAKALNMKVVEKQWHERVSDFMDSFFSNFAITLLIAGSVYGSFLLFVWILSGFKQKN